MAISTFRFMLAFGFGLIGLGFAEWTVETIINQVANDFTSTFYGIASNKEYINTWNTIELEFIVGGLIVGTAIYLKITDRI